MSDNKKVYHKVSKPLRRALKGQNQNHIEVLSLMITAIIQGKSAQMGKMASIAPTPAKNQSTFRRLQRWVSNERIDVKSFFMPFASSILSALGRSTLYVAMDASSVGRGCQTLMFGVIYKKRLLPLCWLTYKGKKGHAHASLHVEGLKLLTSFIPEGMKVLLVADGEYDNIEMLQWVKQNTDWEYVIRTGKNLLIEGDCEGGRYRMKIEEALQLKPDQLSWLDDVLFTAQKHGPLNVLGIWKKEYKEPIYLVTNLRDKRKAAEMYRKRFVIETLFSDQKGRGFGIDKSHISEPSRINRLLLATCLAYIWMIYFGITVMREKKWDLVDHTRQDKSLFRLGIDWLIHVLNHDLDFRAIFHLRGVM